jgi:PhnB protein
MGYTVTPYLTFNKQCEEAFRFYERVLGAKVQDLHRYRGSPMEGDIPADDLDKVMHGAVTLPGGSQLFGSDACGGMPYEGVKGCQLTLGFQDLAEARRTFDALAEGAQIGMPFQATFWAAGFGMLTDRYGVQWCVNCDTPQK